MVAPCGSGKTVVASVIVRDAVTSAMRALFMVHRRELVHQARRKLFSLGIDAGIVAAGFPPRPQAETQIGSIPTLHARAMRTSTIQLAPADLVIVDEAHRCRARTWRRLIDAYPTAAIIGLTGTPVRGDGRGLGNLFEELIEVATVAELIAGEFLPTKVFAPVRPNLSGSWIERGDYVHIQLAQSHEHCKAGRLNCGTLAQARRASPHRRIRGQCQPQCSSAR